MEQPVVRISVRSLVEFVLRSGDIDNRIAAADKDAMQLGSKIHRITVRRFLCVMRLSARNAGCFLKDAQTGLLRRRRA